MEKITSVNNEKIKRLVKLKDKKYRDEEKMFLIEGEDLIKEAKEHNLLSLIITSDEKFKSDIEVLYVNEPIINKLAFTKTPQNIIGVCKMMSKPSKLGNRVVLLDGLQDPSNVGAIIRSSLAFNFDTILVSDTSVDIYNDKLLRSSKGYLFSMNVIKDKLSSLLKLMKDNNYYVITTSLKNAVDVKNIEKKDKTCLIIGNEGNGVSKESIEAASIIVKINMNDKVESLNASVAAGILLNKINEL